MSGSDRLQVERCGGIGGFGQPGAHVRSRGEISCDTLSKSEQALIARLFERPAKPRAAAGKGQMRDGFRYRVSRGAGAAAEAVEVAEADLPPCLQRSLKDELV
jgi:hypothetical protein